MIGNNFLDIMMHKRFTGHQSYVLLCTETTFSNPPSCTAQIKLRRPSIKKSLHKLNPIGQWEKILDPFIFTTLKFCSSITSMFDK